MALSSTRLTLIDFNPFLLSVKHSIKVPSLSPKNVLIAVSKPVTQHGQKGLFCACPEDMNNNETIILARVILRVLFRSMSLRPVADVLVFMFVSVLVMSSSLFQRPFAA